MNLRTQITEDVRSILNGTAGIAVTVTDPALPGSPAALKGMSADIGFAMDFATGEMVLAQKAHVTLSLKDLADAGIGVPVGVAEEVGKPWLVEYAEPDQALVIYEVKMSMVDRSAGLVNCQLGSYDS